MRAFSRPRLSARCALHCAVCWAIFIPHVFTEHLLGTRHHSRC